MKVFFQKYLLLLLFIGILLDLFAIFSIHVNRTDTLTELISQKNRTLNSIDSIKDKINSSKHAISEVERDASKMIVINYETEDSKDSGKHYPKIYDMSDSNLDADSNFNDSQKIINQHIISNPSTIFPDSTSIKTTVPLKPQDNNSTITSLNSGEGDLQNPNFVKTFINTASIFDAGEYSDSDGQRHIFYIKDLSIKLKVYTGNGKDSLLSAYLEGVLEEEILDSNNKMFFKKPQFQAYNLLSYWGKIGKSEVYENKSGKYYKLTLKPIEQYYTQFIITLNGKVLKPTKKSTDKNEKMDAKLEWIDQTKASKRDYSLSFNVALRQH